MDMTPLNLGMIAAYYYINYTTIGQYPTPCSLGMERFIHRIKHCIESVLCTLWFLYYLYASIFVDYVELLVLWMHNFVDILSKINIRFCLHH